MVIEGIGPGDLNRPKSAGGSSSRSTSGKDVVKPASAPDAVGGVEDRAEISDLGLHMAENVAGRPEEQASEDALTDAEVEEIRARIARGHYEMEAVMQAILEGVIVDYPDLLGS